MPVPGSRLDRFDVLELLGAGGMGEVYRARDSRLGREVALKLLPQRFLSDAPRLARFEREAQVLASLNHPNIAVLHEIVKIGDGHALVMELVEGETLAERIGRGALPLAEALQIGVQIATALDAAHERGVVHRDLKPGNVMLRTDGTVKLLDFGLAKVLDPGATVSDPDSVTLTAAAPLAGGVPVLGSPAYMSPEQARGLAVDKRADIWSFGCLLFEALTGRRAFAGERSSDVIAKIIEREPDFTALPTDVPHSIQRLLLRCLRKDRRQRLRDIGDARLEMLDVLQPAGDFTALAVSDARTVQERPRQDRRLLLAAALGAALGGATLWFVRRPAAPIPQVTRFVLAADSALGGGLAISADGTRIAYQGDRGLIVRSRDRLESTLVATSNLIQGNPFFSPDGQWVGFRGWNALKKVPAAGGPVSIVLDQHPASVGTWSGDDIVFADMTGVFRAFPAGGEPKALSRAADGEQIVSVEVLPGGRAALLTVIPTRSYMSGMASNLPSAHIEALDLASGKRHVVVQGGGRPRYAPTGHLLYVSGGTLNAVPFDIDRLQTYGETVPVIVTQGVMDYDVSAEGTLVYQAGRVEEQRELVWVDRQGHVTPLGAPPKRYLYPRISPDGTRVAIDVADAVERDIWMWHIDRRTLERFTNDPAGNPLVTWSRDGRQLVFGSELHGVSNVYRQAADGSGEPERLLPSDAMQMPISYAPDGNLLISVGVTGQQRDIHVMTMAGEHRTRPLIAGPANELWAEVSPDLRWVVYDSDESGQFEVYVRPYPDTDRGGRWQISAAGGRQPLWSPDGRELFYRDFSGALMAVPIPVGPDFAPGSALKLFEGKGFMGDGSQGGGRTYDVAPDGSRFLMIRNGDQGPVPLIAVLHWFEELKRLAPLP